MANNPPKVLLCDASFSALPIFDALRSAGFYVAVCGGRGSDPCHAIADESFLFDYSNKHQLLDVFKKNKFDYLVPGCTDVSYLSSAWVANQLQLPGYDNPNIVDLIHDKRKFREFSSAKYYPIPEIAYSLNTAKNLTFPLLIKPTKSFSGKGIQKVDQPQQLDKIFEEFHLQNRCNEYVFEEFINGKLFSHSAFLKNKKVYFDFFVNEYCTIHPFQVNSSNLSSQLSETIKIKMKNWLETFAMDVDLNDGLFHTQFISNNHDVYLIESARRCPGDLYSKLIHLSTDVNYSNKYIASFCGIELTAPLEIKVTPYSRHTVSVNKECLYISSNLKLPHVQSSFVPLKKTGELLKPAPDDRAGIFFIEHESLDSMEKYTERLATHIFIEDFVL